MLTTIRATIDEHGTVKLLENITLKKTHFVLITILPEECSENDTLPLMLLSEQSLASDWNTPDEDEAWKHLQKAQ